MIGVCGVLGVMVAASPISSISEGMSEVTASIDTLLISMQEAINAHDAGAYMAMVDTADPVWTTEQRAWADDFDIHPVEDVTVERAWESMIEITDSGDAIASIEIVWYVPGEELDRSFAFDALFTPVGLVDGVWRYAGRAWDDVRDDVEGVVVYADDDFEELADRVTARVPVLRAEIETMLGVVLAEDIVVKVYPDMASLQASIALSYTDPLSGWNEPGESIKILGRDGLDDEGLDSLLAHEIGHAVSFAMGEQMIDAPWWVLEGISEVAADAFRSDDSARRTKHIAMMHQNGKLRDFEQLAVFRGEANNHMMHVYLQGWSMVQYFGEQYSAKTRNQWLTMMGSGQSLDEATRNAIGISFDALDEQWRAMLVGQVVEEVEE